MKCPKCDYLGFDTGDRCKHCGYDFSLIAIPPRSAEDEADADVAMRPSDEPFPQSITWDDRFDASLSATPSSEDRSDPARRVSARPPAPAEHADLTLPLLARAYDGGPDDPLIRMPAAPRPPLAVRRTPNRPRLRTAPKGARPFALGPALEFWDTAPKAPTEESAAAVRARTAARLPMPPLRAEASGAVPRLIAVALDHVLLSAIDLAVIYFTLRMTGWPMAQWTVLPLAPLVAFLLLVKLSYFCAFTAVGGQTIGKMAAGIRVVTCDNGTLDAAHACRRTLAATASASLLGLGYLPALVGSEHRALHDLMAGTRVVALPSM